MTDCGFAKPLPHKRAAAKITNWSPRCTKPPVWDQCHSLIGEIKQKRKEVWLSFNNNKKTCHGASILPCWLHRLMEETLDTMVLVDVQLCDMLALLFAICPCTEANHLLYTPTSWFLEANNYQQLSLSKCSGFSFHYLRPREKPLFLECSGELLLSNNERDDESCWNKKKVQG